MKFKELNVLWYRFIWRFLTISILAHYTIGIGVNYLAINYLAASTYLITMMLYNLLLDFIIFSLIITWLQNRQFKNSIFIFNSKAQTTMSKLGISVGLFIEFIISRYIIRFILKYFFSNMLFSFNLPYEVIAKILSYSSLVATILASYIIFFIIIIKNRKKTNHSIEVID